MSTSWGDGPVGFNIPTMIHTEIIISIILFSMNAKQVLAEVIGSRPDLVLHRTAIKMALVLATSD
jgi:hypothetical protein